MPLTKSETDFQNSVIDTATKLGWLHYHSHDSRRSEPGFPDLVLARDGHVLFLELKSEDGRLTYEQANWMRTLEGKPDVHAWTVTPDDWDDLANVLANQPGVFRAFSNLRERLAYHLGRAAKKSRIKRRRQRW